MSLRFSIDDAYKKGWIDKAQADQQKAALLAHSRGLKPTAKPRKVAPSKENSLPRATSQERTFCSIDGDLPQEKLWRACVLRWPEKVRSKELVWEYPGAVPGRRFRLDIAFPNERLACEVDGWEHHGKYLADFKRDRARDRCLVLQGWRVIRFYAEEIHKDTDLLVDEIEKAISIGLAERRLSSNLVTNV